MRKASLSITGILLLLLVILGSCQTLEQISIDYLQPAELTFPSSFRRIGIVNNSTTTPDNKLITEEKKPRNGNYNLETKRVIGYAYVDPAVVAESLAQDIADQNYFETVVICDSALRANDVYERESKLSPQEIEKLTSDLQVDFIVAIENVLLKTTEVVSYMPDFDWFSGTIDLKAYPTFSIYLPERNGPMNTLTPSDSIFWEEIGGTTMDASRRMPPDSRILAEGAQFAGTIPTRYIVPTWKSGVRYFYNGGSAQMRDGGIYVRENNWDKAYEQWKLIYDNTKQRKKKMQAAFNIALYYEMKDNFAQAEEWALKAKELVEQIEHINEPQKADSGTIRISENYYLITQYLEELKKRKAVAYKLNIQMKRFNEDF